MNIASLAKGENAVTAESEDRMGTPWWLLDHLQGLFGKFTKDLAAESWSAVCESFITEEMDLFKQRHLRTEHGFGNWPYGRGQLIRFVPHARQLVLDERVNQLTQLVPHYTADGWWQHVAKPEGRVKKAEWKYGHAGHERLKDWVRLTSERLVIDVIAVRGRLEHRYPPRYRGKRGPSPFSSAVVRFSLP